MVKMKKGNIYLPLQGRIGNQLFQYALARKIQLSLPRKITIVMDDSDILRCGWVNSLENYDLPNVKYIHESILLGKKNFTKQYLLRKIYRFFTRNKNYINKFETEKRLNKLFNDNGMFFCENGYIEPKLNCNAPIYLEGYFQSQLYFDDIKDDLLKLFSGRQFSEFFTYPGLEKIQNRNSVCISTP